MRTLTRAAVGMALATALYVPADARAQPGADRCSVIPDTVAGPTPQQIAERTQLRDRIVGALRAQGAQPAGQLPAIPWQLPPATLDGTPFDVRFRFTLTFRIH